jgi:hypothetical protein
MKRNLKHVSCLLLCLPGSRTAAASATRGAASAQDGPQSSHPKEHFYSPALTYFKGESASSGSSFPRCSFALSIIQEAGANAYAS